VLARSRLHYLRPLPLLQSSIAGVLPGCPPSLNDNVTVSYGTALPSVSLVSPIPWQVLGTWLSCGTEASITDTTCNEDDCTVYAKPLTDSPLVLPHVTRTYTIPYDRRV